MKNDEYGKFDIILRQVMRVSHAEIKAKLEEEKKRKKFKKSSASGHAKDGRV